jgi:hypothetical protein
MKQDTMSNAFPKKSVIHYLIASRNAVWSSVSDFNFILTETKNPYQTNRDNNHN